MESNEKSPIIERLCKFIEASGLSASQFADRAGIPRPSMSQMLHGRNKSLNNHVLSKLNDAFPELNIVWLLFGRGDMLSGANIEISEPQNSLFGTNSGETHPDNQYLNGEEAPFETSERFGQNSTAGTKLTEMPASEPSFSNLGQKEARKQTTTASSENGDTEIIARMVNSKVVEREPAKKIASIIVLFTDNSFETFVPSTDN